MRNYTTQMDAARQGIITPEMEKVAKDEYRTPEEIRDLLQRDRWRSVLTKIINALRQRALVPCLRPR